MEPQITYRVKVKIYAVIPFRFFAKAYTDIGYVYNRASSANSLNNRFLYSGGAGLDILSIYDATISLEYSFNQLGQKGLFLQAGLGL